MDIEFDGHCSLALAGVSIYRFLDVTQVPMLYCAPVEIVSIYQWFDAQAAACARIYGVVMAP
jgi:hypothetical protein